MDSITGQATSSIVWRYLVRPGIMGVIICLESNGFFLNSSFYAIDLLIDCSTYLKRTLAFTRFGGEGFIIWPRSFRRNAIGGFQYRFYYN